MLRPSQHALYYYSHSPFASSPTVLALFLRRQLLLQTLLKPSTTPLLSGHTYYSSSPATLDALSAIFRIIDFWGIARTGAESNRHETRIQHTSLVVAVWLETALRLGNFDVFSHGYSSWILNGYSGRKSPGWETDEMYASVHGERERKAVTNIYANGTISK